MLGIGTLRRVAGEVRRDVRAAYERDPAAKGVSAGEVLAAWPGVHALLSHRIAHVLHGAGVPLAPRALAYVSRSPRSDIDHQTTLAAPRGRHLHTPASPSVDPTR